MTALGLGLGLWLSLRPVCPKDFLCVCDTVTVTDGDTFHLNTRTVKLPDGRATNKIRLLGIDAPEKKELRYEEATAALKQLIGPGKHTIYLRIPKESDEQMDKLQRRLVALVYLKNDTKDSINKRVLGMGLAKIYYISPSTPDKATLTTAFIDAQLEAASHHKGQWDTDKPIIDTDKSIIIAAIDYWDKREQLILLNRGNEGISIDGWYIKDAASERPHRIDLPQKGSPKVIPAGASEIIYSENVWNNDGDTAYLYNAKGQLIDTYPYKGPSR